MKKGINTGGLALSESQHVWQRVKKNMPGKWIRVENRVDVGTPDCCYLMESGVTGWTELKYVKGWPVRADTTTDLGLRPGQVYFLNEWVKKGGRAYLLVRVEDKAGGWLLIPGDRVVQKDTQAGWRHRAAWSGPVANWQAMASVLGHTIKHKDTEQILLPHYSINKLFKGGTDSKT